MLEAVPSPVKLAKKIKPAPAYKTASHDAPMFKCFQPQPHSKIAPCRYVIHISLSSFLIIFFVLYHRRITRDSSGTYSSAAMFARSSTWFYQSSEFDDIWNEKAASLDTLMDLSASRLPVLLKAFQSPRFPLSGQAIRPSRRKKLLQFSHSNRPVFILFFFYHRDHFLPLLFYLSKSFAGFFWLLFSHFSCCEWASL